MPPVRASSVPRGRLSPQPKDPDDDRLDIWGHPDGFPLSQVEVGAEFDGRVTNVVRSIGIFVDFGASKDGILRVPGNYRRVFRRGMQVKAMQVIEVDLEQNRVVLEPDLSGIPEPPVDDRPRGSYRSQSTRRRPQRDYEHPDGTPLEEVQEAFDEEVLGRVTCAGPCGVFVDFGAVKDGRLSIPRAFYGRFKVGDEIERCQVESVNLETGKVSLAVGNLRELCDKLEASRYPIEDFQVGDTVEGYIQAANAYGIFVNIGAIRDARLACPRRVGMMMQTGQFLKDLTVINIDYEREHITLALPEDLEDFDFEMVPLPPPEKSASMRSKGKAEVKAPSPASRLKLRPESAAVPKARLRMDASPETKPKLKPKVAAIKVSAVAVGAAPPRATSRKAAMELDDEEEEHKLALKMALDSIKVRDEVNGVVKAVTDRGVEVDLKDVGSMVPIPGLLKVDEEVRKKFLEGDVVHGMLVEDVGRRLVTLSMESPELSVESDADDRANEKPLEQEQVAMSKSRPKARPKTAEPDARPTARLPRRA